MHRTILAALVLCAPVSASADPAYPTPQAALDALVIALEIGEIDAVIAAVDPSASDLVRNPEDPENKSALNDLLDAWREGWRFVEREDGRIDILLGADGWPLPIPLSSANGGWEFDTEEAREEILARAVGLNEVEVLEALDGYGDIQAAFRMTDHDSDGVLEFAAHVISSDGVRDGLYWPGGDSPIGDLAARANLDGFNESNADSHPVPFGGYYFRILTGQSAAAPGGAMSYLVNGNMVSGHALLAVPADYGASGVHSFVVLESGAVWEADLGPKTLELVRDVVVFDPGEQWTLVP